MKSYFNSNVNIVLTGEYRLGDIRHNYADLTKVKKILGFSPKYSFNEGVLEFVKWVKTQKIMEDKYEKSILELKRNGLMK